MTISQDIDIDNDPDWFLGQAASSMMMMMIMAVFVSNTSFCGGCCFVAFYI